MKFIRALLKRLVRRWRPPHAKIPILPKHPRYEDFFGGPRYR